MREAQQLLHVKHSIVALRASNGELTVFIPEFHNSSATALPHAVASRPDHPPHHDPAGDIFNASIASALLHGGFS